MMDKKTKIKEILKVEGPSLPSKISKGAEFSSIILASAFLSEMVRNKYIKHNICQNIAKEMLAHLLYVCDKDT